MIEQFSPLNFIACYLKHWMKIDIYINFVWDLLHYCKDADDIDRLSAYIQQSPTYFDISSFWRNLYNCVREQLTIFISVYVMCPTHIRFSYVFHGIHIHLIPCILCLEYMFLVMRFVISGWAFCLNITIFLETSNDRIVFLMSI